MSAEKYLNSLPDDTETITLDHRYVPVMPDLTRFYKLQELSCVNTQLIDIPDGHLPDNLEILNVSLNQLTTLGDNLPKLKVLNCRSLIEESSSKNPFVLKFAYKNINVSSLEDGR